MDKAAPDATGSIAFKVYTGSSQEEMDAATEPNGLVVIATSAQPGVEKFEKGDYFRFNGTLLDLRAVATARPLGQAKDQPRGHTQGVGDQASARRSPRPTGR